MTDPTTRAAIEAAAAAIRAAERTPTIPKVRAAAAALAAALEALALDLAPMDHPTSRR